MCQGLTLFDFLQSDSPQTAQRPGILGYASYDCASGIYDFVHDLPADLGQAS